MSAKKLYPGVSTKEVKMKLLVQISTKRKTKLKQRKSLINLKSSGYSEEEKMENRTEYVLKKIHAHNCTRSLTMI